MQRSASIIICVVGLSAAACVDNEISFFIEHAKSQPEGPACTWSPSDEFSSLGLMDLIAGGYYTQGFLVRNQLMAREDLANLKAETNGIFIDGYESSLRVEPNEAVGGTESVTMEMYLGPESTEVLIADIISFNISAQLAEIFDCLPFSRGNYPEDTPTMDANGEIVPRSLGMAYASVRFLGHTNGGLDVATPEFTFGVQLCCGCLVNWNNCAAYCSRYCVEPEQSKMCVAGVSNGDSQIDCREIYYNPSASWDDGCEEENEDGTVSPRLCDCDDCATGR